MIPVGLCFVFLVEIEVKLIAAPVTFGEVFPRNGFVFGLVFSYKAGDELEGVEADAAFQVITLVVSPSDGSFLIFHSAGAGSG